MVRDKKELDISRITFVDNTNNTIIINIIYFISTYTMLTLIFLFNHIQTHVDIKYSHFKYD